MKCIRKSRRVSLLPSGKFNTLPMSSGALKNQRKQKSGRAIALPAPPPPRSLLLGYPSNPSSNLLAVVLFSKQERDLEYDTTIPERVYTELPWLLAKCGEKDRLVKCLTTASIFWSLYRFAPSLFSLFCLHYKVSVIPHTLSGLVDNITFKS